jgi:hypothetical protein
MKRSVGMRRMRYLLTGLALAAALAGCGRGLPVASNSAASSLEASSRSSKAALALYVGMDDYTGSDTQPELKKAHGLLSTVGSNTSTDLFMCGDSSAKDDGFRTRITQGQTWGQSFEALGELNTNRSPDLRNYLAWVGRESGTKQLHLAIATHGGGYGGILLDHNGKPEVPAASMTLQKAYKALSKGYTGGRIPTLTFDACMMASIEVGEALKGTVAVMSGSEDFSMGGSMPWDEIAGALAAGRTPDEERYAKFLTSSVIAKGKWGDRGSKTWSAIALDQRFDKLTRSVDRLSTALIKAMATEPDAIKKAAADTRIFAIMASYKEHYGDYYQRDLVEFCETLDKNVKSAIVKEAAADVKAATQAAVIAHAAHPSESMTHGLAIFLPHGFTGEQGKRKLSRYTDSVFAKHTHWDEFLAVLNR